MSTGIFTAFTLILVLLLEHTFFAALPTPWREIALPLVVGIVIMYRISLSLGVCFVLLAALLMYGRGLTGFDVVVAYVVTAIAAIGFSSKVFARRSLIALSGFAFGTSFIFVLTKLIFDVSDKLLADEKLEMGIEFLHLFFAVTASVISVILLSLSYTTLKELFGRRFMQKDLSYEIHTRT